MTEIDPDRIDEAVLALLYLGLHDHWRTWKGFAWEAMGRLHAKGMISDPVGKAKSVVLTEEGLRESERLFKKLFAVRGNPSSERMMEVPQVDRAQASYSNGPDC